MWDLTKLYTTGEVTLIATGGHMLGDFNGDSIVDAADLTAWKTGFGVTGVATSAQGDADGDLDVDGADFLVWQRQLGSAPVVATSGAVPEPATLMLIVLAAAGVSSERRWYASRVSNTQ
jgi:hypothetical protein